MSFDNLLDTYKESFNFFYGNENNKNQKSKQWESYNLLKFDSDTIKNFRYNSQLSDELDDAQETFSFKIYSEIVNKTSEQYVLNNLSKKNIGNSNRIIPYKDVFVDLNKLIHIYWFHIVEDKIFKNNKIKNICEIGGGFGSFAELFIKNYDTKCFLIDLPEANLMSAYYLKEIFPQKSFFLFNDYKKDNFLSKLDFEKNDIIILPPNCNIDKKIKIDFFINTRSMMEMNTDVIKSYFDFIHEYLIEDGYFLNINRYEKTTVGYPIRISEYPYDNYWKTLISEPSYNQKWIHFLLTKRSFEKNEINIIEELKNIKIIGKQWVDYKPKNVIIKKILKKILKNTFKIKHLNNFGEFLIKIGKMFKNFI